MAKPATAAERQAFIEMMWPMAVRAGQLTGLDPRLIITQSALETGWGKSEQARQTNNYFGIKALPGLPSQNWATKEDYGQGLTTVRDNFAVFKDPADSAEQYAAMMGRKYQDVLNVAKTGGGLQEQIMALDASPYATDPNYGSLLRAVSNSIQRPANLNDFNQPDPPPIPTPFGPGGNVEDYLSQFGNVPADWGGRDLVPKYNAYGMPILGREPLNELGQPYPPDTPEPFSPYGNSEDYLSQFNKVPTSNMGFSGIRTGGGDVAGLDLTGLTFDRAGNALGNTAISNEFSDALRGLRERYESIDYEGIRPFSGDYAGKYDYAGDIRPQDALFLDEFAGGHVTREGRQVIPTEYASAILGLGEANDYAGRYTYSEPLDLADALWLRQNPGGSIGAEPIPGPRTTNDYSAADATVNAAGLVPTSNGGFVTAAQLNGFGMNPVGGTTPRGTGIPWTAPPAGTPGSSLGYSIPTGLLSGNPNDTGYYYWHSDQPYTTQANQGFSTDMPGGSWEVYGGTSNPTQDVSDMHAVQANSARILAQNTAYIRQQQAETEARMAAEAAAGTAARNDPRMNPSASASNISIAGTPGSGALNTVGSNGVDFNNPTSINNFALSGWL